MRLSILSIIFLLWSCSPNKDKTYFELIEANDEMLSKPVMGDWLFTHKEKGQSLEQFVKSNTVKLTDTSNIIYLRPIGNFDSLQRKQINLLSEYLELFFQLKTVVLEDISSDVVPAPARRYVQSEQLLATYVLDSVLRKDFPANGIVLMGITELDLYPKPDWNYVFGLASYTNRAGVSSIYRLQDEQLTAQNFNLCLSRLLKVSSHEIGHMFRLQHCIHAACAMNGSNGLWETDHSPIRLCSLCQRKLHSSIGYDNLTRLKQLQTYFKRNKLSSELELMEKDLIGLE